jgi:hypothetical protein
MASLIAARLCALAPVKARKKEEKIKNISHDGLAVKYTPARHIPPADI